MGLQLSGYKFRGLDVPQAYAKIIVLHLDRVANELPLTVGIYSSKAASSTEAPLETVLFVAKSNILDPVLLASPVAGASGNTPSTNGDISITGAYLALKQIPEAATLLQGAMQV
jgi:hypothetical protein